MKLPMMKYADGIKKSTQIKFGGLEHSPAAKDGELWDMKNMTSDGAPMLATRKPRRFVTKLKRPGGIFAWKKLCWVDGTDFVYDGEVVGQVTEGQKVFASIGAYIVIFPDKCCYNTVTGEYQHMEAAVEVDSLTFGNGTIYGEPAEANTIRCEGVDWAEHFRVGDGVTISGCTEISGNNLTLVIREIEGDQLRFYENSFTLKGEEGTETYTEQGALRISRDVPDMDWICENENRLWGCKDNTVYCSKAMGDIFNWTVYDGLDSDAYYLQTGSVGAFTGAVSYIGYPTFMKESNIYKVYGSVPSNFQLLGSATLGLAEGSGRSMAVAGETLFYLNRNGIMAYTGGVPQPVNAAFGTEHFRDAVAGSDGLKYYVSMQGSDRRWRLYVYDTQRGMWHIEDDVHATGFCQMDGCLYMLTAEGDVWIISGQEYAPDSTVPEETVHWMAEFCDFTQEDPNKKGLGKLQIRLEVDRWAKAQVWIQYDSDGVWHKVGGELGEGVKRSYYLPVIPRRCDHYRLKITGTGACRIYSVTKETYSGSEFKSINGRN